MAVCTSALRGGRWRWGSLGLTSHQFRLIDELQFNERPVSKDVANISEDDTQGYARAGNTHVCEHRIIAVGCGRGSKPSSAITEVEGYPGR